MPIGTPGGTVTTDAIFRNASNMGIPATNIEVVIKTLDGLTTVSGPHTTEPPIVAGPAVGYFSYVWTVAALQALGTYIAHWQGDWLGETIFGTDIIEITASGTVGTGDYTYDLSTAVGQLRFLIQDHDMSSVALGTPMEKRSAAFSDDELAFALSTQPDLYYAAALMLRVWATNKQLIVIARSNSRSKLDYGSIRADLLRAAEAYEKMAENVAADATVEVNWNDFSARQIVLNSWLREGTA